MKYIKTPEFNNDIIRSLNSEDAEIVINALLSVVMHSGKYDLAIETTKHFFEHPNELIRGCSIECVSHIARLWKTVPENFIEATHKALNDKSDFVKGKAEFTIDDLEVFIKDYKKPN